jgi:hypothetical protein
MRLNALGYGMTEEAAKKAGLKFKDFNKSLKESVESAKATREQNQLIYQSMTGSGTPLNITIAEFIKLKKTVKEQYADQIKLIDKTSADDQLALAERLKTQFIGMGMSSEEATKKIYTMYTLSKNFSLDAGLYTVQSDAFNAIKTAVDAAAAAIRMYNKAVHEGRDGTEQANAFVTTNAALITAIEEEQKLALKNRKQDKTKPSFISTEETNKIMLDAELKSLEKISKEQRYQKTISQATLNELEKTNPVLFEIADKHDTNISLLQKQRLIARGFILDMRGLSAEQTDQIYRFNLGVTQAIESVGRIGFLKANYDKLDNLKKLQEKYTKAMKGQSAAQQISDRDKLSALQKQIDANNKLADARIKALDAAKKEGDIAREIAKAQARYESALATGNTADAQQASLDMQGLQSDLQYNAQVKAIEDATTLKNAPLLKQIELIQKKQQDVADAAALAAEKFGDLSGQIDKEEGAINSLIRAMANYRTAIDAHKDDLATWKTTDEAKGMITAITEAAVAAKVNLSTYPMDPTTGKPGAVTAEGLMGTLETALLKNGMILNGDLIINGKKLDVGLNTPGQQADPSKVAGKVTGDGSKEKPFKYFNDAGKAVTEKEFKSMPMGYQNSKEFVIPIKDLQGTEFKMAESAMMAFLKNNQYKDTYTSGDLTYSKDGWVKRGKVFEGYWYAQMPGYTGKVKSYEGGGKIIGPGTGTSDSIPAYLSNGEYVIKEKAVRRYGVDTFDALNAEKLHTGGPVGHRHGRNLPNSKFRWQSYPEDMPDYWSNGKPSGSPFTQRWGELRYGPAKGKDIWGGTEIPGLPFSGKLANRSDYWHQMQEQPSKYRGPGMSIPDERSYPLVGSGASMGGIGNGVYGMGSLTFAGGGQVLKSAFNWLVKSLSNAKLPKLSLESNLLNPFKKATPWDGIKLNSKSAMTDLIASIHPEGSSPFKIKKVTGIPQGVAAEYQPSTQTIRSSIDGMTGGQLTHEYAHHLDFADKHWSIDTFLNSIKDRTDPKALAKMRSIYDEANAEKPGTGSDKLEATLIATGKNLELAGFYRAIQEGTATDKTAGLYQSLVKSGQHKLAKQIGNPYEIGLGYVSDFRHMARILDQNPAWKSPGYPEGMIAAGKHMPKEISQRYAYFAKIMKEAGINPSMKPDDPAWMGLKSLAAAKGFAHGGLIQKFGTGGTPKMGYGKASWKGGTGGATWGALEEVEKFLSLKWGANENASGFSKWARALGRVAFNTVQGTAAGAATAGGLGLLPGLAGGLFEGVAGIIKDGSQYGVKGGTQSKVKGFDPKKELKKIGLKSILENAAWNAVAGSIASPLLMGAGNLGKKAFNSIIKPKTTVHAQMPGPKKLSEDTLKSIKEHEDSLARTIQDIEDLRSGAYYEKNPWSNPEYKDSAIEHLELNRAKLADQIARAKETDVPPGFFTGLDMFIQKPMFAQGSDFDVIASATSRSSAYSTIPFFRALSTKDMADIVGWGTQPDHLNLAMGMDWMKQWGKGSVIETPWSGMASRWRPGVADEIPVGATRHPDVPSHIPDSELVGGLPSRLSPESWQFLEKDPALKIGEAWIPPMHKSITKSLDFAKDIAINAGTGGGGTSAIARFELTPEARGILDLRGIAEGAGSWKYPDAGEGLLAPWTKYILKAINKNKYSYSVPGRDGEESTVTKLIDEYVFEVLGQQTPEGFKPFYKAKGGHINIPKFETGINSVPVDMLAMLHKNEAVVPANMNPFNPNANNATMSGATYNITNNINGFDGDINQLSNIVTQKTITAISSLNTRTASMSGPKMTVGIK